MTGLQSFCYTRVCLTDDRSRPARQEATRQLDGPLRLFVAEVFGRWIADPLERIRNICGEVWHRPAREL